MAKLVDPSDLSFIVNTGASTEEIEIQTAAKTIELRVSGNLSDTTTGAESGVTGKCVYSRLKEAWKADTTLNKFKFPIQMIYEAQFLWINGWVPQGDQTRDLFRDAGFKEADGRENACAISLGAMYDNTMVSHYTNDFTTEFAETPLAFDKTGELNENIQIKGTGGTPDTSDYFKAFLRQEQKTYSSYNLISEQGLAALTFQAYRLPLANAADIDVLDNDTVIGGDAGSVSGVTYSELTVDYLNGSLFETASTSGGQGTDGVYAVDEVVQDGDGRWARCTATGTAITAIQSYASFGGTSTWEAYPGERQIGSSYYAFNRILDVEDVGATKARKYEIYSWAQYQLRLATDINSDVNVDGFGTVRGDIAMELLYFVGPAMHTMPGVFIDGYDDNDKNDIKPHDITVDSTGVDSEYVAVVSTERPFPFVSAGNMNFASNIVTQESNTNTSTLYKMFFKYHTTATSVGTVAITSQAGQAATLDWSTGTTEFDHLLTGDILIISGFATAGNNGMWEALGDATTKTISLTKLDGVAPVDEAASETVTVLENPFETHSASAGFGATIVDDNAAADITGEVDTAVVSFTYDYTNNVQRGPTTNGTDAIVIVMAIGAEQAVGAEGAQYITAEHTITESTGQNININPADELNYENPA
jgi:hypothetical protein